MEEIIVISHLFILKLGCYCDMFPVGIRMGFTSGIFATGKVKDSQDLALCSFLVCRAISDFPLLLLLAGYHGFFDRGEDSGRLARSGREIRRRRIDLVYALQLALVNDVIQQLRFAVIT